MESPPQPPPPIPELRDFLHEVIVATGTPPDEAAAIYPALARHDLTTLARLEALDDVGWAALSVSQPFKTALRDSLMGWARRAPSGGPKAGRRRPTAMAPATRAQSPQAGLALGSRRSVEGAVALVQPGRRPVALRFEGSPVRDMPPALPGSPPTSPRSESPAGALPNRSPRPGGNDQLEQPLHSPRPSSNERIDLSDARTFTLDAALGQSANLEALVSEALAQAQAWGSLRSVCLGDTRLGDALMVRVLDLVRSKAILLELLDLAGNELTSAVASSIAELLAKSPALLELNVGSNRFGSGACMDVLSRLARPGALQALDLSRNPLSLWPPGLSQLIAGFESLTRLEVSFARIADGDFPLLVGSLPTTLARFIARGNFVVCVPDAIGRLSALRLLDLSRNRLERLSPQLAKMSPDMEMDFTGNPCLIMPPQEVVQAGRASIRSWLSSDSYHGDYHPRLKVVALGHGSSGKTTLLRNLLRHCQPARRATSAGETFATAFSSLDLDSYPKTLDLDHNSQVSVWDFPGQLEEGRTCDPFLSNRNAIYLVVVDLAHPSDIDFWLNLLNRKLPPQRSSVRIVIVATKADLHPNKSLLPKLGDDLLGHARNSFPHLPLPERILFVANTEGDHPLVAKALKKCGADILETPAHSRVPELFKEVENVVPSLVAANSGLVYDLPAFEQMVRRTSIHPRLLRYGPRLWSDCVAYLHDMSIVLYGPSSRSVCIQPDAVVRALAAVGLPCRRRTSSPEYLQSLKPPPDHSIPRAALVATIRSLHGLSQCSDEELAQLLKFLQEHEMCFDLPLLKSFYLPARRERAELVMLPNISDHPLVRFLGLQYVEADELVRTRVFFSLQVLLLPISDRGYRIFSNAMFLDDGAATRGLLVLESKALNVIAAGVAPAELLRRVWESLHRAAESWQRFKSPLIFSALCPRCIQGAGLYPTVQEGTLRCERGHVLSNEELARGSLVEELFRRANALWTPKRHVEFDGSSGWTSRGPSLRSAALTATDASGPRLDEYCRVRELFYRFLHEDAVRTFELERVVFLDNGVLESKFQRFFQSCLARFLTVGGETTSSARDRLQSEDGLRKEWRQRVLSHFEAYQDRVSGNGFINLVAGWHGTKEENMFKIGDTNFLEPLELPPENQKDPGYFGKGIYLTQYPSYGAQYAAKETKCLLVSWAIMGRVYPVIESPLEPGNLLGKGCTDGFDSHYAVVKEISPEVYYPCKPLETPDFDELVLFSKHQILPRYVIYYREICREVAAPSSSGLSGQPSPTIVWVDDHLDGETSRAIRMMQEVSSDVAIVQVTSTRELVVWLEARAELLGVRDAIRVITNRRRERDGGDEAAKLLISTLRADPKTKFTKVLVYCGDTRAVSQLEDKKWTFVTSDVTVLQKFCSFRPVGSAIAAGGTRLLQPFLKNLADKPVKKDPMSRVVLWVDDRTTVDVCLPSSPLQQSCARVGIRLVALASTALLKEWLLAHGAQYSAEPKQQVRIVTNRYRAKDGGDQAADLLVAWVRSEPSWKDCQVLVFCTDPTKVAHLRSATTAVTRDPVVATKFAAFEKMERSSTS